MKGCWADVVFPTSVPVSSRSLPQLTAVKLWTRRKKSLVYRSKARIELSIFPGDLKGDKGKLQLMGLTRADSDNSPEFHEL